MVRMGIEMEAKVDEFRRIPLTPRIAIGSAERSTARSNCCNKEFADRSDALTLPFQAIDHVDTDRILRDIHSCFVERDRTRR